MQLLDWGAWRITRKIAHHLTIERYAIFVH